MRLLAIGLLFLSACDRQADPMGPTAGPQLAAATFEGGNYRSEAAKIAHGKRLATLFQCNACHGADYSGVNFGEMIPLVEGLWASNISLTIPKMSDAELERLLRKGVHPDREIYLMPSKQTQFMSEPDMTALIAFLRTIPQVGKPTPLPPRGLADRGGTENRLLCQRRRRGCLLRSPPAARPRSSIRAWPDDRRNPVQQLPWRGPRWGWRAGRRHPGGTRL
jgi:mono/diheme cytochrome c family protein